MVPLLWRTRSYPQDAAKRAINQLQAHANIDESNSQGLQSLHDEPLGVASVHAQESEGETIEQLKVLCRNGISVGDDPAVHLSNKCP